MPESAYGRAALDSELAVLSSTPQGTRNAALNIMSFKLAGLVAGGELEAGSTREALLNAAVGIGLSPEEAEATIDSGFQAGAAAPRSGNRPERPLNASNKAFQKCKTAYVMPDERRANDAHTRLLNDPDALSYVTQKRGLSLETINHFRLGLETDKAGAKWLTIPHYNDGLLVNIKSRSLPPAEKSFKRVKGCRSVLYNADAISQNHDEIFLAEGEFDTLTLIDRGILNAVGTTAGAGAFPAEWKVSFEAVKKIYLCYDADAAGRAGARKVADALGRDRCFNVTLPDGEDVNSFLLKPGSLDKFVDIVNAAKPFGPEPEKTATGPGVFGITAAELMEKQLPEPRWAIPGILPEGLTILAGKPKKGKSIFALNIGIAIAAGGLALGKIRVEPGAVVYLALEDQERRLQKRLRHMLQYTTYGPANLYLITAWPRMDSGGLESLEKKLAGIHDLRLVIIDTLQKFRAPARSNGNVYSEDYDTVAKIKDVADRLGISILLIHHLRKMEAVDVFDTLSGSLGLTGAADGTLVMQNLKGNTILHITGRDVEPAELAIRLDPQILTWALLGDFSEIKATTEQQKVYDALNHEPLTPKEVSEITGIKVGSVKSILGRFIESGNAHREGHGRYTKIQKQ